MQTTCTDHAAVPIHNAPDEIAYRKAASTLVNVGRMVLIFSVWTIIRTLGVVFINRRTIIEAVRKAAEGQIEEYPSDAELLYVIFLVAAIYLVVVVSIRVVIGVCAVAEGHGRRIPFLYIPVTFLYLCGEIMTLIGNVLILMGAGTDSTGDVTFSAVLIELTSVILLIEMFFAALKVRKSKKRERMGGKRHAA